MATVFIVGYTGATGQSIVRHLARDNPFKSIVLIGRRQAELPVENDGRFVSSFHYSNLVVYEICLNSDGKSSGILL